MNLTFSSSDFFCADCQCCWYRESVCVISFALCTHTVFVFQWREIRGRYVTGVRWLAPIRAQCLPISTILIAKSDCDCSISVLREKNTAEIDRMWMRAEWRTEVIYFLYKSATMVLIPLKTTVFTFYIEIVDDAKNRFICYSIFSSQRNQMKIITLSRAMRYCIHIAIHQSS